MSNESYTYIHYSFDIYRMILIFLCKCTDYFTEKTFKCEFKSKFSRIFIISFKNWK